MTDKEKNELGKILLSYKRYLMGAIWKMNRFLDIEVVEDIVFMTYEKILKKKDLDYNDPRFKIYLVMSARNTYIDYYRKEINKKGVNCKLPDDFIETKGSLPIYDEYDIMFLFRKINIILTRRENIVYQLWFQGYSYREIAQDINKSESVVKIRMISIKKKISQIIKSYMK
jgi:RNA polymerase sigma factor (sigma-70 family)